MLYIDALTCTFLDFGTLLQHDTLCGRPGSTMPLDDKIPAILTGQQTSSPYATKHRDQLLGLINQFCNFVHLLIIIVIIINMKNKFKHEAAL